MTTELQLELIFFTFERQLMEQKMTLETTIDGLNADLSQLHARVKQLEEEQVESDCWKESVKNKMSHLEAETSQVMIIFTSSLNRF